MFIEIIIFLMLGIVAGIFTGLIPGVHINLVSILLVGVSGFLLTFTNEVSLGIFIVSMAVTHTFLDSIPSIFLGAPDSDMVLSVLPGHKLLLEGRGYEAVKLTVVGSLLCLIVCVLIIPFLIPIVPIIYGSIEPWIGLILIIVVSFMLLKEGGVRGKLWGVIVFLSSGVLGLIVLNLNNLKQPLFPLLSGLFGISTLLLSLQSNSKVPKQRITCSISIPKNNQFKAIAAAVFSGSLTGMFPGLGSAQAAIISTQIVGDIGGHAFLVLTGGINTVNFVFSLVTLYTLQKARNGAVVAMMQIVENIEFNSLILFISAALVTGGIATILALVISKKFASIINKLDYRKLCIIIISFIAILVLLFSGFIGLFILLVSTFIGMIPQLVNVKRSNAMGCLLLPIILYFVL